MIHHLKGKLVEKNPAYVVIECGGVGYLVNISLNTFSKLPDEENCKIFTHLQINEDAHTLYGFIDEDERRLFRNLISVSGVGASTARMILSSMNPAEIQDCIINEDANKLKSVKGIGEKTALRLILELKNKVKKEGGIKMMPHFKVKDEALNALITLGFARVSVDRTLDQLLRQQPSMTVEDLIRQALKQL
jgi:Holliday junction DNA helicase RuvA